MDPDVPLVVPEVNAERLAAQGHIANPNCTDDHHGRGGLAAASRRPRIRRIVVATYQAASGAGAQAMHELEDQARDRAAGKEVTPKVFPHQIAFNLFSHNTKVARTATTRKRTR